MPSVFAKQGLIASMASRFLRWREDRRTWAELRHLDDLQLKEFGISQRPQDLSQRGFCGSVITADRDPFDIRRAQNGSVDYGYYRAKARDERHRTRARILRKLFGFMRSAPRGNPSNRGTTQSKNATGMITVFTAFRLPSPVTQEQARSIFLSTAPKYQGVTGLVRKTYVRSEDGTMLGGVYLWKSKQEAQAMYTDAWRSFVREKYSTEPTVTYFESPVIVDNVTCEVLTDS